MSSGIRFYATFDRFKKFEANVENFGILSLNQFLGI